MRDVVVLATFLIAIASVACGGDAPNDGTRDAAIDLGNIDARADDAGSTEDSGDFRDLAIEPPDARPLDVGPAQSPEMGLDAFVEPTPDAGPIDADASTPMTSVATCDVPSMIDQYPGFFPPNPFGPWEPASACISAEHDVIVLLGCPSNADGSPSTCQTTRADFGIALSVAGYGRRFITTGAAVANEFVEAESLRALLLDRGVSDEDIVMDPLAEHTDENLYYASRIMQDQGWQTAIVVSDTAGHLVFTGLCDANCCVQLGRMTILDFTVASGPPIRAGHYVLDPFGRAVDPAECTHLATPSKALCLNRAMRRACADDFRL